MTDNVGFLTLLARINPAIWEIIHPHVWAGAIGSAAERVELNPQPFPPGAEMALASVNVAHHIAYAAITAEAAGNEAVARIVESAVDDWCPTGPRRIPWPGPWPHPWTGPEPHPNWNVDESRFFGALTFAAIASRMEEGDTREALTQGADRLAGAALGTQKVAF